MSKNRIPHVIAVTDGVNVDVEQTHEHIKKRKFALINNIDRLFSSYNKEDNRLCIERLERTVDSIMEQVK